ncbi:MAG TPA: hypothetical protein VMF69_06135 [Gemmataceae bacterium]|nr:hypothetical protein [Gemmataceae bacterium]
MAQRPFNPDALKPHATSWLQPNVCNWSSVWRYTVLVPVEQIQSDGTARTIATSDDLTNLELMFIEHLGGITFLPPVKGLGCRDPKRPRETLETNKHAAYLVYAPAAYVSDQYFQALRAELQEALVEGIVMVERQEALLL